MKKIFFFLLLSTNFVLSCYLEATSDISYREALVLNKNIKFSGICNDNDKVEWFQALEIYTAKTFIKKHTFITERLIELEKKPVKIYFNNGIEIDYYGNLLEKNSTYIKIEDNKNKVRKIYLKGN
jgi:hypothetical protein